MDNLLWLERFVYFVRVRILRQKLIGYANSTEAIASLRKRVARLERVVRDSTLEQQRVNRDLRELISTNHMLTMQVSELLTKQEKGDK